MSGQLRKLYQWKLNHALDLWSLATEGTQEFLELKNCNMNATIVIYGSSTGTCEAIAEKIASKLGCEALNVRIEAWIAAISPSL